MTTDDTPTITGFPSSLYPCVGEFVLMFGRLDVELNMLIWHIADLDHRPGRAFTASIPNYRPRATLLEWLAKSNVRNEDDQKKLVKLSHEFLRVADYRHRLLHDEAYWYSPSTNTVGAFRADVPFKPQTPTEFSADWLAYMSSLAFNILSRMQQYRIRNPRWSDDTHFPWHDKPLPLPQKTSRQGKK